MAINNRWKPQIHQLYKPKMLTVKVGEMGREFEIPRARLCQLSPYFAGAFNPNSSFVESQENAIELKDVDEWVFECFVCWLYTDKVAWHPDPDSLVCEANNKKYKRGPTPTSRPTTPQGQDGSPEHENEREEPITWEWEYLFAIYLFADEYDTPGLRQAVMEIVQIKAKQTSPRQYLMPPIDALARMWDHLPESSPLCRFLVEIEVHRTMPPLLSTSSSLEQLPISMLAKMFTMAVQLHRYRRCLDCQVQKPCARIDHPDVKIPEPMYCSDPCAFHEHETAEERAVCHAKFLALNEKHKMGLCLKAS